MDEKSRPRGTMIDPRFCRPAVLRSLLTGLSRDEQEAEGTKPRERPGSREGSGDGEDAGKGVVKGRRGVLS